MFCGVIEKFGIETKVSTKLSDALEDLETYKPNIVILDTSVEKGTGLSFVSMITPLEEEKESRKERRKKIEGGPGMLVIRTVYEVVPSDCPFVKATLVRPFTAEQLTESIKQIIPKERKKEAPKLFTEAEAVNPEVELTRRGITYGESYVFFEERPIIIQQTVQVFANAGYDMMLVTSARAKVARERFGLDKGADVFTLTGENFPLGKMIKSVQDFINERKAPLVAIGDLDNIIEHCGVDMTLRAIQQIVSFRKKKTYTLLISVDGGLLTQNVRNLLTEMMTEYKIE